MALIKGSKGTNGSAGGNGGKGQDETFSQNGKIGQDSVTLAYAGGDGGDGGNGVGIPGGNGGTGGNASLTFNGNILNNPVGPNLLVSLTAQGGDGGAFGTGTPNGVKGNGGNATVTASGNIFQPNKVLNTIELDALAIGGAGTVGGNATSTVNGNIFQTSKATSAVVLNASATGTGTNAATLNGNIVQGNINNVTLLADTTNGTANVNGNIVQTNATNTGFVTVEASGNHIAFTNNKFTLGLQELDWTINATSPYAVSITGNTLKGTGANTFKFYDYDVPGPVMDSVNINLASQTMTFDGQASNAISGFGTVVGTGNAFYTLTGDDTNNTLTGANLADTFTGGKGNDAINGGGGTDTAIYSGNFAQYTIVHDGSGNGTVTDTVAGRDGTDTLTSIERLQFADGTYNFYTGVFSPPNHAPVLDASKSPTLTTEAVNSPAPVGAVGTLVSSLVDFAVPAGQVDNVTDVDAGAQLGIALTGADTANGTWWYTTNGGTTWTALPAVSDSSALLLAADANTRLYLQPTAAYTGTDNSAITFRAWDQTTGANGQSGVDTSGTNNGGSTAFSTASDTAALTVSNAPPPPANTPPTVNNQNAPETYIEDHTLNLTDITVTDPDSPNITATLTLSDVAAGALSTATSGAVTSTYNALTGVWTASGAIADVNTLLAGVSFVPAANYNGNFTIATKIDDNNGNIVTGSKAMTGTPVNDAPVATPVAVNMLEDGTYTFSASDFGFSDPVDAASASGANSLQNVIITAAPANGTLTYNNLTIGAYPLTIAAANIGLLKFAPAANANGAGYASLSYKLQDNGGTANGGVDTSALASLTINVTSVNDAPVSTATGVTMLEDGSHTFSAADFGFSDPNDTPANSLLNVIITSAPANGTLTYNNAAIGAYPLTIAAANIGLLKFTPAANANGATYASFGYQLQDNGGTANGGVDTSGTYSMNLAVTSVNDAPVATPVAVTMLEDNTYTFSASDFGFSDPTDAASAAGANSLLNVIITAAPANGTLTYNNLAIGAYPLTIAAANVGLLKFTPAPNANGNNYASISYKLQDNGGTLNGGVDTSALASLAINVTPVNDPPVAVNDSYVTGQNTPLVVGAGAGLLANDSDIDSPSISIGFLTTPAHGSLGVSSNGAFTYTPNSGFVGTDTFTYQATDGSLNSNTATVTIKVDGAPTANDDSYTAGLNTPLVISAATGVQSNDSDPESDPLTSSVVTGPANGMLTLNADGSFTYTPNLGFTGSDSFTYKDNDGILDSNTATVTIDVQGAAPITSPPAALVGTAGDDFFVPDATTTSIDGLGNTPTGGDTVSLSNATSGVTASTDGAQDWTASGLGMTTLTNIENLTGSSFDDVLTGQNGVRNTLNGGSGDDTLVATSGDGVNGDTLNGGAGNDTADFSLATGPVVVDLSTIGSQDVGGGIGPITLTSIENLTGSAYADTLTGDAGDNILNGGAGADTLYASGGNDTLDGGDGVNDTADFTAATQDGLKVDLSAGSATGGGLGNDILSAINNVTGSAFNDTLIGDANSNVLDGAGGNNILYGNGGTDTLIGGAGTDTAYFAGREADPNYTVTGLTSVTNFTTGVFDGLIGIDRLKFLSPTHVSDLDNDGAGDLVYQKTDGTIQFHTVAGTTTLAYVPASTDHVIGTGQFDPESGRQSGLLLQDSASGNLQLVTGINTVTGMSTLADPLTGAVYNTAWKAIGTGDYNGDASSDVLMFDTVNNKAEILLLKENNTDAVGFVNNISALTGPGANWKPIASGDFNGDGKSDILWQNSVTKQIEVSLIDDTSGATATTLNTPTAQAATGLTAIGTGDFNGDGKSDILFQNASGQAVIWFMNGDTHAGTKTITKPAAGFTVSGAQDVDNNGYSDVLWTNTATGAVTATELQGPSSLVSVSVLGNVSLTAANAGYKLIGSTGGG